MPWPKKGEKKSHYISRAIPEIMADKDKDSKQAAGQAYGMWKQKKPAKKKVHEDVNLDDLGDVGDYDKPLDRQKIADEWLYFSDYATFSQDSEEMLRYLAKRNHCSVADVVSALKTIYKKYAKDEEDEGMLGAELEDELEPWMKDETIESNDTATSEAKIVAKDPEKHQTHTRGAARLQKYWDQAFKHNGKIVTIELIPFRNPNVDWNERLYHVVSEGPLKNQFLPAGALRKKKKREASNFETFKNEVLEESFVTKARCPLPRQESILLSIYKNPSLNEMRNYVAIGSRGYINHLGDLYMEGYEDRPGHSTSVTHGVILQVLNNLDPSIEEDPYNAWGGTKIGVSVQRAEDTTEIYIGESVISQSTKSKKAIKYWIALAAEKNPRLTFYSRHILRRPPEKLAQTGKRVREGISKKYYWKNGGPTRYQNTPNSFNDINSHRAGMALDKGFDLNKNKITYSGPVVGDSLYTVHENTLQKEEGICPVCQGTGERTKKNGEIVECKYCDGVGRVEKLNERALTEFFKSLDEDGVSGGVGLSGNFQAHAPENMIGLNIGLGGISHNRGTGNTKHGKMDDRTWDSAYTHTRSEDYLRTPYRDSVKRFIEEEIDASFELKYEPWPFEATEYTAGWPSWVLYKDGKPVAALSNDNEHEDDVSIRHIETKVKSHGYAQKLIEMLLDEGVTIKTGKPNYNSVSPTAHKMFGRINQLKGIQSKVLGPADNTGKGYDELDGVDVNHYQWKH